MNANTEQMAPTPIDTLQAERDHYRESNRKASDRILELTKELAQYRGIIDRVVNAFLGTLKCPALDLPTGLPDPSAESEAKMRGILKTLVQEHCGFTGELKSAEAKLAELAAQLQIAREAHGCFEAAMAEGFIEALVSSDICRVRDIWDRRLSVAQAALAQITDVPVKQKENQNEPVSL